MDLCLRDIRLGIDSEVPCPEAMRSTTPDYTGLGLSILWSFTSWKEFVYLV